MADESVVLHLSAIFQNSMCCTLKNFRDLIV